MLHLLSTLNLKKNYHIKANEKFKGECIELYQELDYMEI